MLGLRLTEGIDADLANPTGLDVVRGRGWIEELSGRLRLTSEGQHFCSEVALVLIGD